MQTPLVLTVSQLNIYTKSILEQDVNLANVFVSGEISNFTEHYKSGHLYMTIKDSACAVKAVMFAKSAARLKFRPENGMSVIIRGRVSIYERDGQYQLYIDDMQPDGIGALSLAAEQLKQKLEAEGLFAPEHKKALPRFPSAVGVISSPTGAAVQDVLNVLERRFPIAFVVFAEVTVQGDSAPGQVAAALRKMNELNAADVIIIARGGGSIEDLWPFNSELLAREIYNSHIPVISGVGHETDFTICDFAADLRAPTPSAAAELAVPDIREQLFYLDSVKSELYNSLLQKTAGCENEIKEIEKALAFYNPVTLTDNAEIYLDAIQTKLSGLISACVAEKEKKFAALSSAVDSLNPVKVLSRGYSVVKKSGSIVKNSGELSPGDEVEIMTAQGGAKAKITEVF